LAASRNLPWVTVQGNPGRSRQRRRRRTEAANAPVRREEGRVPRPRLSRFARSTPRLGELAGDDSRSSRRGGGGGGVINKDHDRRQDVDRREDRLPGAEGPVDEDRPPPVEVLEQGGEDGHPGARGSQPPSRRREILGCRSHGVQQRLRPHPRLAVALVSSRTAREGAEKGMFGQARQRDSRRAENQQAAEVQENDDVLRIGQANKASRTSLVGGRKEDLSSEKDEGARRGRVECRARRRLVRNIGNHGRTSRAGGQDDDERADPLTTPAAPHRWTSSAEAPRRWTDWGGRRSRRADHDHVGCHVVAFWRG